MAIFENPNGKDARLAELSLATAAIFAVVAIGFFIFVFFWHGGISRNQYDTLHPATEVQKQAAMQQLTDSRATSSASVSSEHAPAVPAQQGDAKDPDAAAKLKVLQSLNGN